jgi:hypothetical protein
VGLVRWLLDKGAAKGGAFMEVDGLGPMELATACSRGHLPVVRLL